MNERERAELLIDSVRKALENGCRHYDPETKELLPDARAVLKCLVLRRHVLVHQPRKCPCGHFEYAASVVCPSCGGTIPPVAETTLGHGMPDGLDDVVLRPSP